MSTRVLFVDDEPAILNGFARVARRRRADFEVSIAVSGAEALEILGGQTYAAVVSDMRMPSMDGAELLAEVHRRHPATLRVVLSGQTDHHTAHRALPFAHMFLSKPCDPNTILDAMALAQSALSQLPYRCVLPRLLGTCLLPVDVERRTRLLDKLSSGASQEEITLDVGQDVGLGVKVMQIARSPFFGGLRSEVNDLEEALRVVGSDLLYHLVAMSPATASASCSRRPGPVSAQIGRLLLESVNCPRAAELEEIIGDALVTLWAAK